MYKYILPILLLFVSCGTNEVEVAKGTTEEVTSLGYDGGSADTNGVVQDSAASVQYDNSSEPPLN